MEYKFHKEFDYSKENHGIFAKFYNYLWGLIFYLKNGKPEQVFRFGGGLGDHLLCTVLFHELKKYSNQKIWMMSFYPKLFALNPSVDRIVPDNWRVVKYCEKFGKKVTLLSYGKWIDDPDKIAPPKRHMITEILQKAGIKGKFSLKPRFFSNSVSPVKGKFVCIQGTNTFSSTPVKNKQWEQSRMNQIALWLSKKYYVVQVGLKNEDLLEGTADYREILSINKLGALLKDSLFFIGQEGFVMHLARSQNTRSVILYGGRIKAWQSGYPCNENIESDLECSPCWQNNLCDYDRQCMSDISIIQVKDAIGRIEQRLTGELETEVVEL